MIKQAYKIYGEGLARKRIEPWLKALEERGIPTKSVKIELDPGFGAFLRSYGRTVWPQYWKDRALSLPATALSLGMAPLSNALGQIDYVKGGPFYSDLHGHIMVPTDFTNRQKFGIIAHEIGHQLGDELYEPKNIFTDLPHELSATGFALKNLKDHKFYVPTKNNLTAALATYLSNIDSDVNLNYIKKKLGEDYSELSNQRKKKPSAAFIKKLLNKKYKDLDEKELKDLTRMVYWIYDHRRKKLNERFTKGYSGSVEAELRRLKKGPYYELAQRLIRDAVKRY